MTFASAATALPRVRSGDWRALGATSLERIAAAPEIPTVAKQDFPGFAAAAWFSLLAPACTPPAVVERAHRGRGGGAARAGTVTAPAGAGHTHARVASRLWFRLRRLRQACRRRPSGAEF
jgi:Tripartite tricarboxylate transporter family receptor